MPGMRADIHRDSTRDDTILHLFLVAVIDGIEREI